MNKLKFRLSLALLASSCQNGAMDSSNNEVPVAMQPVWNDINLNKFPLQLGQVIKLKNDSILLTAIVLDFNEDDGGQWVGLCLMENNKLFGRQIPNSMINTICLDLLDFNYLLIDSLPQFQLIETLELDKTNIGIGSSGPAHNLSELKIYFDRGIEQRKKQQTPCDKDITALNPVRECYFNITKIIN